MKTANATICILIPMALYAVSESAQARSGTRSVPITNGPAKQVAPPRWGCPNLRECGAPSVGVKSLPPRLTITNGPAKGPIRIGPPPGCGNPHGRTC
jgi:hypothetical protein